MDLAERVTAIEERNQRVETDKAWETSWTRRGILAVASYLVVMYFLVLIEAPNPWLAALVPAGAYLIQQAGMPWLRRWWVGRHSRKG